MNKKPPTQRDLMKLEIAKELGLDDKISKYGWKGLSARESGRIGGIMASREKKKGQNAPDENK